MMRNSKFLLIVILGLLTALGPLATDIYLPSFEDIAQQFGTSVNAISLTISSFFLGLAIGQIIYGPLLERFGRKRPMYVGVIIYISASVGCGQADSLSELVMFRFFQALGACGGMVSARAIVRDLFEGKEVAKVFSMLMMVLAVSPILAPTIGGLIAVHFGWQVVFYIMAVVAVLLLISAKWYLPAGKQANANHSLKLNSIVSNYLSVFRDPYFSLYAVVGSVAYSGVYAYVSGSPLLYLEFFDVTKGEYSIIFGLIATGLIGSTQVNNLMLKWYTSELLVNRAMVVQSIVATILIVFHFLHLENVALTTFLIACYMGCLGFIFPNASALAMSRLAHAAGNASALLGSIQMIIGAIAAALVGALDLPGSLPMLLVMTLCAFGAQLLIRVLGREKKAPQFTV